MYLKSPHISVGTYILVRYELNPYRPERRLWISKSFCERMRQLRLLIKYEMVLYSFGSALVLLAFNLVGLKLVYNLSLSPPDESFIFSAMSGKKLIKGNNFHLVEVDIWYNGYIITVGSLFFSNAQSFPLKFYELCV